MKLIVCVDDNFGMLFNKRRQSKDSHLRADMLELTREGNLWMNAYSANQFEDASALHVDEAFLDKAAMDDYCFVENTDMLPYADGISGVIVYRWNRAYPSDVKFPIDLFQDRWTLISSTEFAGSSHEKITREIYEL